MWLEKRGFSNHDKRKENRFIYSQNKWGNEVAITNYGGAIVAIMVPDKNGDYANVIQGHDNIQDVINSPEPYLSTLIGRYGNRICKGEFQLNGKNTSWPLTTVQTPYMEVNQDLTQKFGTH